MGTSDEIQFPVIMEGFFFFYFLQKAIKKYLSELLTECVLKLLGSFST